MKKEKVSYPQANNFNNVLKLVSLVAMEPNINSIQIQEKLKWRHREINYYLQAANIIGLIDKDDSRQLHTYTVTNKTLNIVNKEKEEQIYAYIKTIMEFDVCKKAIRSYLRGDELITTVGFYNKMKEENSDISEITLKRRASTLKNWSQWAINHIPLAF